MASASALVAIGAVSSRMAFTSPWRERWLSFARSLSRATKASSRPRTRICAIILDPVPTASKMIAPWRCPAKCLHPEHAEVGALDRRVERGGQAERQDGARLRRIDDAVVPQPGAGVIGVTLALVLVTDRRLESFLFVLRPALPRALQVVAAHLREHVSRLLAAHHRDAGVRPHPQKARSVRAPAHGVV